MVLFPSLPSLHLLLAMSVSLALVVEDDRCPPEYFRLPHYNDNCFYIGSPTTWTEAWKKCHSDLGIVYSFNDLYKRIQGNAFSNYLDLNGINRTWTGIHIRDGKLRVDTLQNQSGISTRIYWASGQPNEGEPGDRQWCTSTNLAMSACPSGYYGSPRLQRCYKEQGFETFEDAANVCKQDGGRLARVDSIFHLNVIQQALSQLRMGITARPLLEEMESPVRGPTWVDAGSSCNVIDSQWTSTSYHWSCYSRLPYLCETAAVYEEKNDITATLTTRFITTRPIGKSGDLEVFLPIESESPEVARLNCIFRGFTPEEHGVTWYHDGVAMPREMYSTSKEGVQLSVSRGLRAAPITLVGYYWCETLNRNKTRLERSNSIFLRNEGENMHAGSIGLEQTGQMLPSTYNQFNLAGVVSSEIDMIVKSYNSTPRNILPTFIHPLRFRNNGTILDFISYQSSIMSDGFQDPKEILQMTKEDLRKGFGTQKDQRNFFKPNTLHVRSIDFCFDFKHVVEETGQEFLIPQTKLGETFYSPQRCLVNNRAFGEIECKGDKLYGAYWGDFRLNDICNVPDLPDSPISPSLQTLSEIEITDRNVEKVLENASAIIRNATLTVTDLLYVTSILENSDQLPEISVNAAGRFLDIYEIVLETSDKVLMDSQTIGKVASRVLKATDMAMGKLKTQPSDQQKLVSTTFATEVWETTGMSSGNIRIGLQIGDNGTTLESESLVPMFRASDLKPDTFGSIFFKNDFLSELNEGPVKRVRISVNVYQNTRLFEVSEASAGDNRQYQLNSNIIAAKILVDGRPVSDLDGSQVTAVFVPIKALPTDERSNLTTCGYWNFTGNDNGGSWSTDGCRYVREEYGRDVCVCDHLTNFAVLLDFYGQDTLTHTLALSIITIVGLSLSILGLSLTVLTFIIFSKLRRNRVQQTLFNLALAELFSWIVFLAGINQTQDYIGCITVAVLLHYLILVSFMWMLMEAVLHYFHFVKVLGTYIPKYMLKTAVPAWGLPLLPPIIILAIDPGLYRGGENYCWMSLTPFYYGFSLPVGLIIVSNIVLYIMVVVNICRTSSDAVRSTQTDRDRLVLNVRASCLCFILLGLSWVFGYLAIADARVVFQYIFTITNTLQGFLIFLLFTARNKEVRDSWRELCCKKKTKDVKSNLYSVSGTANTKESTFSNNSDSQIITATNSAFSKEDALNSNQSLRVSTTSI